MDYSTIRQYSLQGFNKEIKKQLISDQGLEVYNWIARERQSTTAQVANKFKLSSQHASGLLNKLYKQNYLRRDSRIQSSGGQEWMYYP